MVSKSVVRSSDELHHVLVAGDDDGLDAGGARLRRQRADHVVGLDPGLLDHGQPERLDEPPDVRDLRPQLVRHGRPGLLVVGVQRVAEGLPGGVEDHGEVLGARRSRSSFASMLAKP